MATIIIQLCLYSPGHGVYQSFTGSHWHALPRLHDDVSPPSSTWRSPKSVLLGSSLETCFASPSSLPSTSSVNQWSSWRCVWGHCHAGTLPCYPVSGGRGSCSAAVFHSICWSSHFPQWNVTLQHLQDFLCIVFRRGFLLGWQPCTPIWCRVRRMVWALTGWAPTSLNLCCNADSTPTRIFQRKHLDVTLSTCAQFLWTTYPMPVLSGPRTFTTLDDLSHSTAAQFQDFGNLLVALAIFMLLNNTSFKIIREFFAIWCHVGTFIDQYERVWELHYKCEYTCSLCTHWPSNTKELHDILEGKWQTVLNLDI